MLKLKNTECPGGCFDWYFKRDKLRNVMKKTFAMAIAMAGLAGSIFAATELETAPAGYIEKADAGWYCNPFDSFASEPTLGDLRATPGAIIKVFSNKSALLFTASYLAADGEVAEGWYAGDECKNSFALARGSSIQFLGGEGSTLVIAGLLNENGASVQVSKGAKAWIGNLSPLAKTVGDIVPDGNFNPAKDYATFKNGAGAYEKAVYLDATYADAFGVTSGWYKANDVKKNSIGDGSCIDSWVLSSGDGFMMNVSKDVAVSCPGLRSESQE